MYNGNVIRELLLSQKKKGKDLLDYLQVKSNGSLTQIVNGNPTAERLEQIADFFGVSIDTLFIRESAHAGVADVANPNVIANLQISRLEAIIVEKDKQIALLEEMIEVLKQK